MPLTREFLKTLELNDTNIDSIMTEHGDSMTKNNNRITELENTIKNKDTEIATFTTQIAEYKNSITALEQQKGNSEELQRSLSELQTQLTTAQEEHANFVKQIEYDTTVNSFFNGMQFTSELAKEAVMTRFKAQNFPIVNGKFDGGEAFIADLKTKYPTEFAQSTTTQQVQGANNTAQGIPNVKGQYGNGNLNQSQEGVSGRMVNGQFVPDTAQQKQTPYFTTNQNSNANAAQNNAVSGWGDMGFTPITPPLPNAKTK